MKEFFTISQTAKIAGVTSETLRHYDRIGLVKPCKVDEWTGYRYYSQQEIVRLNTIHALRCRIIRYRFLFRNHAGNYKTGIALMQCLFAVLC